MIHPIPLPAAPRRTLVLRARPQRPTVRIVVQVLGHTSTPWSVQLTTLTPTRISVQPTELVTVQRPSLLACARQAALELISPCAERVLSRQQWRAALTTEYEAARLRAPMRGLL